MSNNQVNRTIAAFRPSAYDILFWLGLFLAMLFGMVAKVIHDNIQNGTRMDTLFEKEVILPILVSPIVFGGIYGMMKENPRNIGTFIFAFQNGFFWKAVFSQETPSIQ